MCPSTSTLEKTQPQNHLPGGGQDVEKIIYKFDKLHKPTTIQQQRFQTFTKASFFFTLGDSKPLGILHTHLFEAPLFFLHTLGRPARFSWQDSWQGISNPNFLMMMVPDQVINMGIGGGYKNESRCSEEEFLDLLTGLGALVSDLFSSQD